MTASRRRRTRRLKWGLSGVILLSLGIVIALFSRYRHHDAVAPPPDGTSEEATISVGRVEHTATRHGRVEWRLSADTVRYINEEKKAVFRAVDITFFTQNDEEIRLVAREGELHTDSQDIHISGDVQVTSGQYRLEAPQLQYAHDQQVFVADTGVRVESRGSHLSAEKMTFFLDSDKADLRGNVEGVIDDAITF